MYIYCGSCQIYAPGLRFRVYGTPVRLHMGIFPKIRVPSIDAQLVILRPKTGSPFFCETAEEFFLTTWPNLGSEGAAHNYQPQVRRFQVWAP